MIVEIRHDAESPTNQNGASFRYGLYISSPSLPCLNDGTLPFRLCAMTGRKPRETDDANTRPKIFKKIIRQIISQNIPDVFLTSKCLTALTLRPT